MAWNDGLTGPVLQIASSNASPMRVIAGPGTGKTFALKRKVARLLEEGGDPEKILIITFTRMAARDLEREITSLNIPGVDRVRKGTFHSLCLSILNNADVLRIIGRTSRLLMEYEKRFLLEDLGVELGGDHHEDYNHRRRRLMAFEAAWAREQDQEPGWPLNDIDRHFQGIMIEWLLFHKAMLVGELIPLTLRYLRDNPASPELQQNLHVLVDEYQDLNRAEQHLIDILATTASLTVVGDEDQSIYEAFRYAHPEGISQFHIHHPNTLDIPLTECRRCPTTVVAMANELIANNLRRLNHPLNIFQGNDQGNVHIVQWLDMESEAAGLADFIDQMIKSEVFDPGKTLILSPRKQFGFMIRDALRHRGRAAHSFFQEELLEGNPKNDDDNQAQQALTLLTLFVNPDDMVALRCWLGFGSQSLGSEEYYRLKTFCTQTHLSPKQALDQIIVGSLNVQNIEEIITRFVLLKEYQQRFADRSGREVFNEIFPLGQDWAEPFRLILEKDTNIENLEVMLKLLQSNIVQPEMPIDVDYIRIMSLHKSKGLNADHVIVTGCVEGILPQAPINELPFEEQRRFIEEQRRLFYVAITRAKKTLILSSISRLPRPLAYKMRAIVTDGNRQFAGTITSSFIAELGPNRPRPINGDVWLENFLHRQG